ncbi:MAG TPA: LpxI family protein, partial [Candidatus Methylomirabilis sp.]|nr:LpxI family protein [Candidatus Methylomirabilis sp.]
VADELAKEGVTLRPCTDFLSGILLGRGVLTRRAPTAAEREDIRFGREIARTIAALKIGQTVVIKRGTVVAVESIEGTDAAIRRGGALAKEGVVVVKASRPDHDFRFDVPVIGESTVEALREVGGRALAVEADRTLCLDREKMVAVADEGGIAIIAE